MKNQRMVRYRTFQLSAKREVVAVLPRPALLVEVPPAVEDALHGRRAAGEDPVDVGLGRRCLA